MYLIRGGHDFNRERSPEEMQKHMQKWVSWMGSLAEQGTLIGGQPLQNEGNTLIEGGKKLIDRPLVEGKELVGGYLLVRAENLDHATNIARDCPGFEYGCTVEIREVSPMPT